MRAIYLTPALAASCFIGLTAAPRAAHAQLACSSGYHADANGSCQSDSGEVSRYCPAGQVYHPWINGGWICETPGPATSGVAVYADPAPRKRAVTRSVSRVSEEEPAPPRIVRPEPQRPAPRVSKPARRVQQARSVPAAEEAPAVAQNPAPLPAPIVTHGGSGGGGGGGWSDRRLKRDIVRLGTSPSGLPIYAFQYVWGGPRYIGVMAQDLLKLRPDAVILDEDSGYYKVDYSRIDVEMREERHAA